MLALTQSQYLDEINVFFTTPVNTTAGATLNGIITLTGSNGTSFDYNTQFTNIPGTSLDVTGIPQLTWATETLEAYGMTAISDYPAGTTVFSDINVALTSGETPSIAWNKMDDTAEGLSTAIDTDGATEAQITITY